MHFTNCLTNNTLDIYFLTQYTPEIPFHSFSILMLTYHKKITPNGGNRWYYSNEFTSLRIFTCDFVGAIVINNGFNIFNIILKIALECYAKW